MIWCAREGERKNGLGPSAGCVLAQLGVNTRENSFLIKILHSRVMNYIAQIDFNENSSFLHGGTEKNLRGKRRMLEDKRRRKLLAAARCVYTLLCEKKIAALIIPHLTLRLKNSPIRQPLITKAFM